MLILSRKIGTKLIINEQITITVVGVSGNVVKIGVEAPKEMNVRREELPPKETGKAA